MLTKRFFYPLAGTLWLAIAACAGWLSPCWATSASITITADNYYDLYVNGTLVGSQNNSDGTWGWDVPETWTLDLSPGTALIAVAARDESAASGSGIGLIAKIVFADGSTYVTDTSWKVSDQGPPGWEGVNFDDSGWSPPLDEGAYDSLPWVRFAAPIGAFASSGAHWLWRGNPPFLSGYGYYNAGGFQFCFFRKAISVPGITAVSQRTWGSLKARYR